MAAIVCHGLQSHLESQIVESRTLRLRLPSSKPFPTHSQQPFDLAFKKPCLWDSNIKTNNLEENKNNNHNKIETQTPLSSNPNKKISWSFLEALSNVSTNEISPQYVHPQHNRSSWTLSPRSLELCTENLGSESGSDTVENEIDMDMNMNMNMNMLSLSDMGTREQRQPCKVLSAKKGKAMNFPPPLTTITGSESLRVMPHRENGRLVIEVTKAPPMFVSSFHAERSNGRLRLRFLNNHIPCFDPEDDEEEKDVDDAFENEMHGQIEGVEEGEEDVGDADATYQSSMLVDNSVGLDPIILSGFGEEFENGMNEQRQDAEKGEEDNVDDDCEYDMRMEKYERSRRCKEGGEHENNEFMLNWGEPLWVVTS